MKPRRIVFFVCTLLFGAIGNALSADNKTETNVPIEFSFIAQRRLRRSVQ